MLEELRKEIARITGAIEANSDDLMGVLGRIKMLILELERTLEGSRNAEHVPAEMLATINKIKTLISLLDDLNTEARQYADNI